MPDRPPPTGEIVQRSWVPVLAIVAVALMASIAGLGNQFAQDDLHLIQDNVLIHDLSSWIEIFRSPFWPPPFSPDLYRPFTSIALSVQYMFGAGEPTVFRVVSYVLYAAVSVRVFRLARLMMPDRIALGTALLFAAHPVHVEAVALGVGQSELAVALIAAIMVERYVVLRRNGWLSKSDWALMTILYLAASLFKEQGLVISGLLIAAELLLIPAPSPDRARRLLPGFAVMILGGVLVLLARRAALGGDVAGTFVAEALVGASFGTRALTMLRVVPAWLRLLTWPAHLQADYSPREVVASHAFGVIEAWGALLLILLLATAWRARRDIPGYSFGFAWCAVALFPVSNLVVPTGIVLAERTLFLPSVGFLIALGALVSWAAERFTPPASEALLRTSLTAICLLLVMAGIARSVERQRVWRNDAFLVVRTVQDAPLSFRAQQAYGDVAFAIEKPDVALHAYQQALQLAPAEQAWRIRNQLALALRQLGQRASEAEQLRASLAQRPEQEDARGLLIAADLATGQYDAAARQADTALARGGAPAVFVGLRRLADSAAAAHAAPGSVIVGINTGSVRRVP